MAQTATFDLEIPDVGGDENAWGTLLNAYLNALEVIVDARLAKAGGAMTGRMDFHSATVKLAAASATSGTSSLDLATANYFTSTPSDTITFEFTNCPSVASTAVVFLLRITNGGAETVNWPASVDWDGGSAPTLPAAGIATLLFITENAGTDWRGSVVQADV